MKLMGLNVRVENEIDRAGPDHEPERETRRLIAPRDRRAEPSDELFFAKAEKLAGVLNRIRGRDRMRRLNHGRFFRL